MGQSIVKQVNLYSASNWTLMILGLYHKGMGHPHGQKKSNKTVFVILGQYIIGMGQSHGDGTTKLDICNIGSRSILTQYWVCII